jgi:hypothetical protein
LTQANPHLIYDPGTIIAYLDETFGVIEVPLQLTNQAICTNTHWATSVAQIKVRLAGNG